MTWIGDPNNPVPNIGNVKTDLSQAIAQDSSVLSDKKDDVNRAKQVRRDTDIQKNPTIKLIDIDIAIMKQLEKFQLKVTDDGKLITVPLYYASPEKWKSIQKDGIIRDFNGKMILPALVFQRTTSEKDQAMMMFNRYLTYPVLKQYSEKNRYTRFDILMDKNTPVHEVYDVVMPDHMIFTYHFIIWTEYVEQINTIVERINFETDDYWGDLRGFRFRTKIDSFSHTIELQVDQDRLVKSEFDLIVHGYLLPDIIDKFSGKTSTTQKSLTPKKVVFGIETVGPDFEFQDKNSLEKWRNPNYPNLPLVENITPPPISVVSSDFLLNLTILKQQIISVYNNQQFHLPPPITSTDFGQEGWISYDKDYYYIYTNGLWKRVPIALFNDTTDF